MLEGGACVRNSGSVALILAQMSGQGESGAVVTAHDHDVEAGLLIAREAGAWATRIGFEHSGDWRIATIIGVERNIHDHLVEMVLELIEPRSSRPLVVARSEPAAQAATER